MTDRTLRRLARTAARKWRRHVRYGDRVDRKAMATYVATGKSLIEARASCPEYRDWLKWLESTGIPIETVGRMMLMARLHRAGENHQALIRRCRWVAEVVAATEGMEADDVERHLLGRPDLDPDGLWDLTAYIDTMKDFDNQPGAVWPNNEVLH